MRLCAWKMRTSTTGDRRVSTSSRCVRCWIVNEPNAESHECARAGKTHGQACRGERQHAGGRAGRWVGAYGLECERACQFEAHKACGRSGSLTPVATDGDDDGGGKGAMSENRAACSTFSFSTRFP